MDRNLKHRGAGGAWRAAVAGGVRSAVALCLAACGGAEANPDAALDAAARRIDRAVSRAAGDAESADAFVGTLRYNPARCACPAWELRVGDAWVRADVRAAEPEAEPAWLVAPPAVLGTVEARLTITRDAAIGENGWAYPVLEMAPAEPAGGQ